MMMIVGKIPLIRFHGSNKAVRTNEQDPLRSMWNVVSIDRDERDVVLSEQTKCCECLEKNFVGTVASRKEDTGSGRYV